MVWIEFMGGGPTGSGPGGCPGFGPGGSPGSGPGGPPPHHGMPPPPAMMFCGGGPGAVDRICIPPHIMACLVAVDLDMMSLL